jgi:hypothetical protein
MYKLSTDKPESRHYIKDKILIISKLINIFFTYLYQSTYSLKLISIFYRCDFRFFTHIHKLRINEKYRHNNHHLLIFCG